MDIKQYSQFNYFVKGDISGIQDFIFNVRSERAAKTLKARSFFISALSSAALTLLRQRLGADSVKAFYEGGGNFYAFIRADKPQLDQMKYLIAEALRYDDLYLTLSYIPFDYQKDVPKFGTLWANLNQQSIQDKMRAFEGMAEAFVPFRQNKIHDDEKETVTEQDAWRRITDRLAKSGGYNWSKADSAYPFLYRDGIALLGQRMGLTDKGKEFDKSILNKLPKWNETIRNLYERAIEKVRKDNEENTGVVSSGDEAKNDSLISFEHLSAFAGQRNGSAKLGILKLDVDNLSQKFNEPGEMTPKARLSEGLGSFFNERLWQLLEQEKFEYRYQKGTQTDIYQHNLYPIFAGGDDGFFIGGWDAIFEFSLTLRKAFDQFLKEKQLPKLTLSAALVVVDDKFPVVRFAELADEALAAAKNHRIGSEEPTKNKISIFGEVLTWEEFEKAREYALKLEELVRMYNRPKSVLNRLKNIGIGYDRLQKQVEEEQRIHASQVTRLAFYLGKLHSDRQGGLGDKDARELTKKIINECQQALLRSMTKPYSQTSSLNFMLFPVAARWAELLCRNAKSD